MIKLMSGFAIGSSTRQEVVPDAVSADEPMHGPAMADLERRLEQVDENDPRALASLMRQMSQVTGERFDEPMEEVVRKLEEGMDPESLEEKLPEPSESASLRGVRQMRSGPVRDPGLYDY